MAGSLDGAPLIVADTPPLSADAAPSDDMLLLTQSRGPAAWSALACALLAATGVAVALVMPARSLEWWFGSGATVAAMAGGALSLAWVLRPARLTVGADGIDLWQVFGARSLAWEEVAAIGHTRVRRRRGQVLAASGVRIARIDGVVVDLPPGWQMADDDLIELLVDAWQAFTSNGLAEMRAPTAEPAFANQPQLVV